MSPTPEEESPASSPTELTRTHQVAKRYRARRITVSDHNGRHCSLPTQLPYIPSTSSLVSEMARWVEDYDLESIDNREVVATPATVSSTNETPVTSTTSSPMSSTSCPVRMQSFGSATSQSSTSTSPPPIPSAMKASLKRKPLPPRTYGDSPTLPHEESSMARTNESSTETVTVVECCITSEAIGDVSEKSDPSLTDPDHLAIQSDACTVKVAPETFVNQPDNKVVEIKDNETPDDTTPVSPKCSPPEMVLPIDEPQDSDEKPPQLPPRPKKSVEHPPSTGPNQDQVPPISSHARRRRAHQRRMQAVYDRDSD